MPHRHKLPEQLFRVETGAGDPVFAGQIKVIPIAQAVQITLPLLKKSERGACARPYQDTAGRVHHGWFYGGYVVAFY